MVARNPSRRQSGLPVAAAADTLRRAMDAVRFEFFFDFSSPYSYLASTQLPGIEGRTGARARLLPITLGGVRKSTGHQMPPAQQLKYMAEDTARWAQKYGVPMQIPAAFPISTILSLRACIAAIHEAKGEPAMRALFRTYWAEGKDISQIDVVEGALDEAGLSGTSLVARAHVQDIKDELRRNTDLALQRGLFGVPTIFVGERSFWGNDRLEFVESALRHARLDK
jgi:2-hydroxychromene-2-carboxylate isomerase